MDQKRVTCLIPLLVLCGCLLAAPALAVAEEAGTESGGIMAAVQSAGTVKTLTSAFLVLYGGISLFAPKKLWGMGPGRKDKMKREPTPGELNAERISGAIFIFLGVMLFLGRIQ